MSRIGKRPVVIAKGVTAKIDNGTLTVKGPKGELKQDVSKAGYPLVDVKVTDSQIVVERKNDDGKARAQHGLMRALIQNMVTGVVQEFSRELEIRGVGYKAEVKGKSLNLNLGFSHPVDFPMPKGITISVDKQTNIKITGADKQLVGETAAKIRRLRPPEPYKGKGIRYMGEEVKQKVGKAAAGTTGG